MDTLRSCLHCTLERVLATDARRFGAGGLCVEVMPFESVLLPETGARVYRQLRRFLRRVQGEAVRGTLRLAVLSALPGKSEVEVLARFPGEGGWRLASCSFPRYRLDTLWRGFAESDEQD